MADDAAARLAALAEQAVKRNNASLAEALTLLRKTIEAGVIPKDEASVKNALTTIQQEPGVFRQVYDLLLKGSISGAAGNALYAFIINLVSMLPK
jgi:hypothetical protein